MHFATFANTSGLTCFLTRLLTALLLQDLKSLVRKRQPLNHASRVDVRCSALKWQLLSAEGREAMVTAAIADLSLTMSRNQDLSGEATDYSLVSPCQCQILSIMNYWEPQLQLVCQVCGQPGDARSDQEAEIVFLHPEVINLPLRFQEICPVAHLVKGDCGDIT